MAAGFVSRPMNILNDIIDNETHDSDLRRDIKELSSNTGQEVRPLNKRHRAFTLSLERLVILGRTTGT